MESLKTKNWKKSPSKTFPRDSSTSQSDFFSDIFYGSFEIQWNGFWHLEISVEDILQAFRIFIINIVYISYYLWHFIDWNKINV